MPFGAARVHMTYVISYRCKLNWSDGPGRERLEVVGSCHETDARAHALCNRLGARRSQDWRTASSSSRTPLVKQRVHRDPLVEGWYARDPAAVMQIEQLLEKAGLSMDHVMAQTLSKKLDEVERIDRMIANAEGRRHVVLREIDRHRGVVAARLRTAAEAIEEGEYTEVRLSGISLKGIGG